MTATAVPGGAPGALPAAQPSGIGRWLPIMEWLPRYQRGLLRFDLIAALTTWALVVPQAIAYAQIAGLSPQAGLFACIGGLLGYALLGTSKQLVVTPTSSTAAISASLVGAIAFGDVARFGGLSAALAITVGVIFAIFGVAKLGFVARFIPTAVQVGFMFGLGMTIIVSQVPKLLGVSGSDGSFFAQFGALLGNLSQTNLWTLALGLIALAALLLGRQFAPGLPMALIVVVGGIVAVALLGLTAKGVAVIGLIPGALPLPAIPAIQPGDLVALVPGALAISVVGCAESLTVAQQFAEDHRYEIRPDQELVASGGANVLSGLLQGFIIGGGASQSAANDRAGARTQLAGLLVAGLVLITSIALLPLFQDLPQAVLGAIVISAVVSFLRVGEMRRIERLRRDSFVLALFSLVQVLILGILPGLIVAVALSLAVLLVRLAKPETTLLGTAPGGSALISLDNEPAAGAIAGFLTMRLEAPVLFLNASLLRDEVRSQVRAKDPPPRVVMLDLAATAELDIESMDTLLRLAEQLREGGTQLWLADARAPVRAIFDRAGVSLDGPEVRIFRTTDEAMQAFDALQVGPP